MDKWSILSQRKTLNSARFAHVFHFVKIMNLPNLFQETIDSNYIAIEHEDLLE